MADVTINYRSSSIATMNSSGSVLLETQGKYCDSDLEVVYVSPGGGSNLQVGAAYSNGMLYPDTGYDGFSAVDVDVANSYTQWDEGKVVSSGALVSQTSLSVTANGTYDTTLKNSVTVNVAGGASGDWTVALASHTTGQTGAIFDAPTGLTAVPAAYILFLNTSYSSPASDSCIAIIHDSTRSIMWQNGGTSATQTSNYTLSVSYSNGKIVIDDDNTYGLAENGAKYSLLCVYGGTGSITFRTAAFNPNSQTTTATFGTSENPPLYFIGLEDTLTPNSTHKVQTVVKSSAHTGTAFCSGTNVYTSNAGYYNNFADSYSSSTLTVTSNSSSTSGYFTTGAYTLYYLTQNDLFGASLGTKSITANGTYNASSDGYDGYSQVTVNVSGGGGYTLEDFGSGNITGDIVYTGTKLRSCQFMQTGITSFIGDSVNAFSNDAVGGERAVFRGCTQLQSISMTSYNVTTNAQSMFQGCSALTSVNLPAYTTIQAYTFRYCTALENTKFQGATNVNQYAFQGCTALKALDFGINFANITGGKAFDGCTLFDTLVLRRTSPTALGAVNNFDGTCFANGKSGGHIYIPKTLYDALGTGTNDYKALTNWSTLDGYGTITWHAIEGSYYETHYADGTLIPTT